MQIVPICPASPRYRCKTDVYARVNESVCIWIDGNSVLPIYLTYSKPVIGFLIIAMQLLSSHNGKLLKVDSADLGGTASVTRAFSTGLEAVDRLLPGGGLGRGVVHEVLWAMGSAAGGGPLFFGAWGGPGAGGPRR